MPRRILSIEDLSKDVTRRTPSVGLAPVPSGTLLLVRALDFRMNSNTVVASIPVPHAGEEPSRVFARWLDDGAPGLAEAARACDWDDHFREIRPGAAPWLSPIGKKSFLDEIFSLLTTSPSPYENSIADPKAVLDAFVAAEFPKGLDGFRFFSVDVPSLDVRFEYFDHLGSDRCLLWYDDAVMRVLFTNGSD